jgi:PAS domain S-box-containing protein
MSAAWPVSLAETIPAGLVLIDRHGDIVSVNDAAEQLIGFAAPDLVGDDFFTRFESFDGMAEAREAFMSGGPGVDLPRPVRFRRPDREEPSARVRIRTLEQDGERYGVVVLEDADLLEVVRSVRHDVNNSLMGLMGHAELLRNHGDLSAEARAKVDAISIEIDRVKERMARLGQLASYGK